MERSGITAGMEKLVREVRHLVRDSERLKVMARPRGSYTLLFPFVLTGIATVGETLWAARRNNVDRSCGTFVDLFWNRCCFRLQPTYLELFPEMQAFTGFAKMHPVYSVVFYCR